VCVCVSVRVCVCDPIYPTKDVRHSVELNSTNPLPGSHEGNMEFMSGMEISNRTCMESKSNEHINGESLLEEILFVFRVRGGRRSHVLRIFLFVARVAITTLSTACIMPL
jgi:pyruvate/2-oxoacid:ferredoxin oxidoreductase beta subunit